ncbi:MAG: hypothetical protein R3C16_14130, partial [Hyphomonadaceae bacterium]
MSDFFASKLGVRGGGKPEQENPLSWSELLAGDAPRTAEGWSVPEAFLAVLLAAVTCDGELAAAEREELVALAHRSRALKSLSPAQLGELNALVAARMNESDAALADACAALPEDMRLSVFAHALDLVL